MKLLYVLVLSLPCVTFGKEEGGNVEVEATTTSSDGDEIQLPAGRKAAFKMMGSFLSRRSEMVQKKCGLSDAGIAALVAAFDRWNECMESVDSA